MRLEVWGSLRMHLLPACGPPPQLAFLLIVSKDELPTSRKYSPDSANSDALLVWRQMRNAIRAPLLADQLRAAADGYRLRTWTELMTVVVLETCSAVGWVAAGKGAPKRVLPVGRGEYLSIDVLAFGNGEGWRQPVAAFELENSSNAKFVGYALWKACMVRARLAVLITYRRRAADVSPLIQQLEQDVLTQVDLPDEVLVLVGSRAAADTFPDGYYQAFGWSSNRRRLVQVLQ